MGRAARAAAAATRPVTDDGARVRRRTVEEAQRMLERVVPAIVELIDIDAIVRRVDVDALVAVDVDALVARVDVTRCCAAWTWTRSSRASTSTRCCSGPT